MTQKKKLNNSGRFLDAPRKKQNREVFIEGDWASIRDTLALMGWDHMQREAIHLSLKRGFSLSIAANQAATKIGRCPIQSKRCF